MTSASSSSSAATTRYNRYSVFGSGGLPRRGKTPTALPGRVEGDRRLLEGFEHPPRRLLSPLLPHSSDISPSPVSVHVAPEAGTSQGDRRGSCFASGQRRRTSRVQNVPRIGFSNIHRTQKGRWLEANHQPEVAEQDVFTRSPLQDGYSKGRGCSPSPRRLVRNDRLEGRVLPRPRQSPLPSLRLEEEDIRISRPPLRPLPRAFHLHADDEASPSLPPCARDSDNLLLGRPPHHRVLSRSVCASSG